MLLKGMNNMNRITQFVLLSTLSLPVFADYNENTTNTRRTAQSSEALVKYLKNLGNYLGFDLDNPPAEKTEAELKKKQLLDVTALKNLQKATVDTMLGAIPMNAITKGFVPTSVADLSDINQFVNNVWKSPDIKNDMQLTKSPINQESDNQKSQEMDPVNQALFNILSTPDNTFCMDDKYQWKKDCSFLTPNEISQRATNISKIKAPDLDTNNPLDTTYNKEILNQLNSSSLISPLQYSLEGGKPDNTPNNKAQNQMSAQTEADLAANFIRYATGAVTPLRLPKKADYIFLLADSRTGDQNNKTQKMKDAETILADYMANLRVYTAQRSVAIGNLYEMMNKRLPQTSSNQTNKSSESAAVQEFKLATQRLIQLDSQSGKPSDWLTKINEASPETVQKEMAVLLAEINYQLYLNRQQQERILLTNTMMLMQLMRENSPSIQKSILDLNNERAYKPGEKN